MSVTIDGSTGITLPDSGALSTSIGDAINITSGYVSGIQLGGTGAANNLDDYEEGTWTPKLYDSSTGTEITNAAYNANFNGGRYIKVGNKVTLTGTFRLTSKGTVTGGNFAGIGGLPFATLNAGSLANTGYRASSSNINQDASQSQFMLHAANIYYGRIQTSAGVSQTLSNISSTHYTQAFSLTYLTNS